MSNLESLRLCSTMQELRIIVASATLDAEQFRDFFETNRWVCGVFSPHLLSTLISGVAAIGHQARVAGLPFKKSVVAALLFY